MKLIEAIADRGDGVERRRIQLVFCRDHANRVMQQDEWFGPSQWRDEGWFIGVGSEPFDLGALLAGPTNEAAFVGRAVAHMIGFVPRGSH